MTDRLKGKTALITGAARGIGAAIATLFASQGCRVLLTDINDAPGTALTGELNSKTASPSPIAAYAHLDVAQECDWQALDTKIKHFCQGPLDILVNNAGITGFLETSGPHDPEMLDLASWQRVNQTNLDGVALGCKYGIGWMRQSSAASIINISSRSGLVGIPGASAYAASKAAVRNHSKTVALYCAQQGLPIRCNSVHPGAILTPLWDAMLGEGQARESAIKTIAADIPLQTMGTPEDVAFGVLYLASDESKYVTGIELNIDGGILAGSAASPG